MKIEELEDLQLLKAYARIPDDDEQSVYLLKSVYLPAAISHIKAHTGVTTEQLEESDEMGLACLALCTFLYDNRSMVIENDKINRVIASMIDHHSMNLV